MKATINLFLLIGAVALLATGCPKKTADLELDAARQAIADAARKKAKDCAKETFQAAEAAIAEANRLAEAGEIQQAKAKANEAKTLAEQANAASQPGCDQPKVEEKVQPKQTGDTDAASTNLSLGDMIETVYFDYNDATIREDSKAMLSKVASALAKTPAQKVEIEGHCDVRGSTEYNLHLGERRAHSVEKYLTTQGVKPNQLSVISYGEERPADLGDTEAAHQKNRRAELKKQ